ncbi:hypothetical protein PRIPAC_89600 [Pristionchus pacificus]|uniref:Uncharacterized protein n=1 Tax=Pristionchus pacificus TaxID=54126 RepID=A0A2A6B7D1_PRIPA|nr:hypothetical protein PRIPAC_89600 [Pristionchus pacificus]|eukprot:PDM61799.1 hypothetical protein PRIPAC_51241 [Pristionchus pacificus]
MCKVRPGYYQSCSHADYKSSYSAELWVRCDSHTECDSLVHSHSFPHHSLHYHHVQSRKDSHIKDGMGYPYSHGKVDIEILFREYRKLYVNRLQDEDRQMSNLHQYFKDLIVIVCNISITSLLWAGAFANKKNCLPICALLETIFLIISSVRSVSFLVENGAIGDSNSDRFVVASALFGIFFVYLFIIVRRVIAGYYWDLYARDVGRRNPNIGKKIDVEKALANNADHNFSHSTELRLVLYSDKESDRLAACGVLLGVFLVYIIFVPLRVLRVTFIIELVFVSLFFLYTLFANDNSMQDYVDDAKEFERYLEPQANLQSVSGFIRNLSTCACHFFVALLLWASVYAKKKHCLPLYAVLEGVLIIEITMSILRILSVVISERNRKQEHIPLGGRSVLQISQCERIATKKSQ